MWTIGEVKRRARKNLKIYYWSAFVVTLLVMLLGGDSSGYGISGNTRSNRETTKGILYDNDVFYEENETADDIDDIAGYNGIGSEQVGLLFKLFTGVMAYTIMVILVVVCIAFVLLRVFVGNPVMVGQSRFFMESRAQGRSAGVGQTFWAFKSGHYLNVVKIMFLRDLYNGLWYLLLVIPGVVKAYEYSLIPYILSENPEADARDVFALTKDMTADQKFQLFVLDLSFIGWLLFGIITCGISTLFLLPYMIATGAEVYAELRGKIDGFPFGGFGESEEPNVYQQVYGDGQ